MVGRLTQTEAVSCAVVDDDLWTSRQRASELGGVRELDRSKFRTWLIENDISLELASCAGSGGGCLRGRWSGRRPDRVGLRQLNAHQGDHDRDGDRARPYDGPSARQANAPLARSGRSRERGRVERMEQLAETIVDVVWRLHAGHQPILLSMSILEGPRSSTSGSRWALAR